MVPMKNLSEPAFTRRPLFSSSYQRTAGALFLKGYFGRDVEVHAVILIGTELDRPETDGREHLLRCSADRQVEKSNEATCTTAS